MSKPLVIRPEAEADLGDALAWYESRREGLGAEFLLAFEAATNRIRRNPESYQEQHRGIRRALVRRFPYAVFYVIGDEIAVIAVMHVKRHPRRWQRRK